MYYKLQPKIECISKPNNLKRLLIFVLLINSHSTVQALWRKCILLEYFFVECTSCLKQAADTVQGVEPLTFSQFFANQQQRGQVFFLQRYLHWVRERAVVCIVCATKFHFFNLLFMPL